MLFLCHIAIVIAHIVHIVCEYSIFTYGSFNGHEISSDQLKFMNILKYSRIFREAIDASVGEGRCRISSSPKSSRLGESQQPQPAMVSFELSCIGAHSVYSGWPVFMIFFFQDSGGQSLEMERRLFVTTKQYSSPYCYLRQRRVQWKTGGSHSPSEGQAAASSQPAPVPAEQHVLVRYAT